MNRQCNMVRDNLAAYQAQALSKDEAASVTAHLSDCAVCQNENAAQQQMRQHLLALKQQDAHLMPSRRVWANAEKAWKQRDALRRRRVHLQFAMASALLLLFIFGAVWARRSRTSDFPIALVKSDYMLHISENTRPEYETHDADKAATWLSGQLHSDIQPINEKFAQLTLKGADVLHEKSASVGRLLYYNRNRNQMIALYIAPGATGFKGLPKQSFRERDFCVDATEMRQALVGWDMDSIGYAFVMPQPIDEESQLYALTACHELEHTH